MNSGNFQGEVKKIVQQDSTTDGFNLYQRLTNCLGSTQFSVPEYLNIRRELFMRRPFFISLKDYLKGKFSYLLCCCNYTQEEARMYRYRQRLFNKASKRLTREFDAIKLLKRIKKLNIVK